MQNNIIKISIPFMLIFFIHVAKSQEKCLIKGKLTDESGTPIYGAQILLLNPADSSIVNYDISDEDGNYELDFVCSNQLLLKARSLSHMEKYAVLGENIFPFLLDFELRERIFDLEEVIVNSDPPIKVQGDTTTYSVSYFTNEDEQTVEDVLKKLPGIDVSESGSIKYKGKSIDKILLDGENLVGSNYKVLSKNLSAHLLDKVDVVENYSDETMLRGIIETNEIALNLRIKENMKAPLFGKVEGGSNFYNRYGTLLNLLSYSERTKVVFLGQSNNIGNDPSGYEINKNEAFFHKPNLNVSFPASNYEPNSIIPRSNFIRNNSHYGSLNSSKIWMLSN